MLACRDLGHAWEPLTALRRGSGSVERTLRCSRCGTVREDVYTIQRGRVRPKRRRYRYPFGYVHKGGRVSRAEARALLWKL